jgi:DNA-binding LacI/PurR family transcriptional regulator
VFPHGDDQGRGGEGRCFDGDRQLKGVPADTVVSNKAEAAGRLAEHVLSLGHRRVGILRALAAGGVKVDRR